MMIGNSIHKLRTNANLSQEQFALLFEVSQQTVQKWECEKSSPSLNKIIQISRYFGVSLDALIMGNDNRVVEEMKNTHLIKPQYENIHDWEFYSSNLITEYNQSIEEGLDIGRYKDVFSSVAKLPKDEITKKLGDTLFEVVNSAKQKSGYPYIEPSDLETIKKLRKPDDFLHLQPKDMEKKIHGAWVGRICGCMLGKTVEGVRTYELIPFLKDTGNFPMHRYILRSDLSRGTPTDFKQAMHCRCFADEIDGMPIDDDTNYTVLYQEVIEKYGRDFTPFDVSRAWLALQPKDAYCTAERVAFCNFIKGYAPPESASFKNPYREWIGAQIRADYFGYINPGNPELAAEMAWRDASISHTKNGIYGEMFVAAMLAVAAETNDVLHIIRGGLAEIPCTSRLYEQILSIIIGFENGVSQEACFRSIHAKYNENDPHDWCHTISNAMIVVAALLYGRGDYSRTVGLAVAAGFDTDCNGATVGSVFGMANGVDSIPESWVRPIKNTLHTSIFGVGTVRISDCVKKTLKHLK